MISEKEILTSDARYFLGRLHRNFENRRRQLLGEREKRQSDFDSGKRPDFLKETEPIRKGIWQVAFIPKDLEDRRVEITGPVDAKMMINALNSGANVYMADFEDSLSPRWDKVIEGQKNLIEAVRHRLHYAAPDGKRYELKEKIATLLVRPRAWHLVEKHFCVDGDPISASLFDFGLYFFHNVQERLQRTTAPYFYLPKLENHLEARLWTDVFSFSEETLGVPHGTIKATILIETIIAAFEMDEILYELKDYAVGLNAGRWDYLFSVIKKFRNQKDFVFPDRAQLTMTLPFMRAYTNLLVQTCHRRGAHAIGGMSAFVPIRKDLALNERAFAQVRGDKEREAKDGFDGTWVAHPDLVSVAKAVFDKEMPLSNQKDKLREDVKVESHDLLDFEVRGGVVTEEGVRNNISVSLQYLEQWLKGVGASVIFNLMEDVATAEIARAQLWQWLKRGVILKDGRKFTQEIYTQICEEEIQNILACREIFPGGRISYAAAHEGNISPYTSKQLLDDLTLSPNFYEFLTLPAYDYLQGELTMTDHFKKESEKLTQLWNSDRRWHEIKRRYKADEVIRLRPSIDIEYSLARRGAEKLWELLDHDDPVCALGALTGAQAVQMVKAGLKSIYISGWQVAADANLSAQTYPDQSLYPSNSVPALVRRINNALMRADQVQRVEKSSSVEKTSWYVPILADAEAGFGGPLHAFELMKSMIEAGAAAVHFEDQLASEKKCGHLGGKVLVPTSQFVRTLTAARLASDLLNVPTLIVARTDALSATLLTSDIDEIDRQFLTGERTLEGYFRVRGGIEAAITRALSYAPYADLLWMETSTPDLGEAREFSSEIRKKFPGKRFAYNCSPSFHWKKHLDEKTIRSFREKLSETGYKYQFITLAGWHSLNLHAFDLAHAYRRDGMSAYVRLQSQEFSREEEGYTATRHQREVGTNYMDQVLMAVSGGEAETVALKDSTETSQFHSPSS